MTSVAIVTGDFVPTGGMDRANYALASFLARSGCSVELVAHRAASELLALPNTRLHRVAKPCGAYTLGQWLLAHRGRQIGEAVVKGGGRVIVNGGNCRFGDINWVHYVHAAYRPESAASWPRRLKQQLEYPLHLRNERVALRRSKLVVCNSRRTQTDVVERVGIPRERTCVVYYGNDPKEFYPADPVARVSLRSKLGVPAAAPLVVFIGALGDRRKGFDALHAAWETLCRDADWDAVLLVVGVGAELDAWRRRSLTAGMGARIRYVGFRKDVADILRAADLLVSPTRYEAYGLGVHEALCCGLPAVVSASAGVAERYPKELRDLLLTDPNDVPALASILRRWRAENEVFKHRVMPFGAELCNYTWDDMSRELSQSLRYS